MPVVTGDVKRFTEEVDATTISLRLGLAELEQMTHASGVLSPMPSSREMGPHGIYTLILVLPEHAYKPSLHPRCTYGA